jgi:hypothetical protein
MKIFHIFFGKVGKVLGNLEKCNCFIHKVLIVEVILIKMIDEQLFLFFYGKFYKVILFSCFYHPKIF